MGLFDSIRRVVGDGTAKSDDTATQPDLVDTRGLDSLARFDDAIDADYDETLATSDEPATYATDTALCLPSRRGARPGVRRRVERRDGYRCRRRRRPS